jgi:hypothetical protein
MAPDVKSIMGMQAMWKGSAFNACKTCGYAATVLLQSSIGPADHMQATAAVAGDPTGPSHVADRA